MLPSLVKSSLKDNAIVVVILLKGLLATTRLCCRSHFGRGWVDLVLLVGVLLSPPLLIFP